MASERMHQMFAFYVQHFCLSAFNIAVKFEKNVVYTLLE